MFMQEFDKSSCAAIQNQETIQDVAEQTEGTAFEMA